MVFEFTEFPLSQGAEQKPPSSLSLQQELWLFNTGHTLHAVKKENKQSISYSEWHSLQQLSFIISHLSLSTHINSYKKNTQSCSACFYLSVHFNVSREIQVHLNSNKLELCYESIYFVLHLFQAFIFADCDDYCMPLKDTYIQNSVSLKQNVGHLKSMVTYCTVNPSNSWPGLLRINHCNICYRSDQAVGLLKC